MEEAFRGSPAYRDPFFTLIASKDIFVEAPLVPGRYRSSALHFRCRDRLVSADVVVASRGGTLGCRFGEGLHCAHSVDSASEVYDQPNECWVVTEGKTH